MGSAKEVKLTDTAFVELEAGVLGMLEHDEEEEE